MSTNGACQQLHMCGASTPYVLGVRTICAEHVCGSKRQNFTQRLGGVVPSSRVELYPAVG